MKIFSNDAVRHHFRPFGLSAICIASNPDGECFFADAFIIADLPWKPLSTLMPFTTSQLWMATHPLSLPDNFPFHAGQTSIPFYGDFGSSLCLGQTFCIQTDWCWLLHFSRTILILLLSLYVYNSFTLDCFTLLVVLPKNKIRSIINSFKLLNSEHRDF